MKTYENILSLEEKGKVKSAKKKKDCLREGDDSDGEKLRKCLSCNITR